MNNVKKLLDESLQSYYWLGFILADGSFTRDFKRLRVALGNEDQPHLKSFVEYLDKEFDSKYSGSFMDSKVVPQIAKKLGLNKDSPKTYAQPDISAYEAVSDSKFLALFIGFIDGDGSIQYQTNRETVKITIKLHATWLDLLEYMVQRVFSILKREYHSEAIVDSRWFAKVSFANFKLIREIKEFIILNNIVVLDRKWNKINLELETQDELLLAKYLKIESLLRYNVPLGTISDALDLPHGMVKRISAKYTRGQL